MNLLLSNTAAGNAQSTDFWFGALRAAGIEAELASTDNGRIQTPLTKGDCLIVAGGDGTVRAQAGTCIETSCRLGVLPTGTGNDFARGLNIPLEPDAACANLATGEIQRVDVGLLNDEIFLNVAHIGLGSEISAQIEGADKHWWGRFAYARTLVNQLRRIRGFHARIECADEVIEGRWLQITVANGRSFGGGQHFFDASPTDGELDLLAVRPRPLLRLFLVWLLAHVRGTTPTDEAIFRRRGKRFKIMGDSRREVTADGETLAHLPVRFGIRAAALRVVVPPSRPDEESMYGQGTSESGETGLKLIRSDKEAMLGELKALGSGTLLRYRDLLDAGAGTLEPILQRTLRRRSELVERIAEAEQARARIRSAPDTEINEVRALSDRIFKALLGEDLLQKRILKTEQDWQSRLELAKGLDWNDDERELLDQLVLENRQAIADLLAQQDEE